MQETEVRLCQPIAEDGAALHELVAECPPLDVNSRYCNLLHCTHFAPTSVAAYLNNHLVGFVSGYLIPNAAHKLFIWQVAVSQVARKRGLAQQMLREILERPACSKVTFLQTTITPDNEPSRALFSALARELSAPIHENVWFERTRHFSGAHADEILLQIGPFPPLTTS